MNGCIFSGMNLKKQNKISTPFKKWTKAELIFHFLHFFCHFLPLLLKGGKVFAHRGKRNLFIFKGLVNM